MHNKPKFGQIVKNTR